MIPVGAFTEWEEMTKFVAVAGVPGLLCLIQFITAHWNRRADRIHLEKILAEGNEAARQQFVAYRETINELIRELNGR